MPDPHQIGAGIFAGPHQIAHCLYLGVGHGDRGDLTQTQQPGQMCGVTSVGLDPVPAGADQLRWRSHHAVDVGLAQSSRQPEPRRPGLIGRPHRAAQPVQPLQDLAVIRA